MGKRYLLKIVEYEAPPKIGLKHSTLVLYVRPSTPLEKRQRIIDVSFSTKKYFASAHWKMGKEVECESQ